jgi:Vitamin K-dependent gamma-carboxylase
VIGKLWRAWVELLDRKEPPTALALVRIGLAFVLLIDFVSLKFAGLVGPLYSRPPAGFAWGDAWLSGDAAWALAVVSLVALVLGAATRVACVGFVIASAALSHLTPDGESGLDMLARVVFLILALSRSNARWSLDAWIAKRMGREVPAEIPAWPRYLLLFELVWVYFSGGMNKSSGSWGPQGGFTALANALSDPHAARFSPNWVGAIYPLTRIATAATMAFELGAPLFLLAYFKRWRVRWVWIALGISFELGIAFGLRLGSFPYGMLALYPVLLYPDELHMPRSRQAK